MTDHPMWRISSFSANGGSCVAVADLGDRVAIRNSNRPDRGTISFSLNAMAALVDAVKTGELDDLGE